VIIKKSVLCASVYLLSSLLHTRPASAVNPVSAESSTSTTSSSASFDDYVAAVYNKIDFGNGEKLSTDLFNKAMRGYLNLKNAGKLTSGKQILTIVDFTKSSATDRLWVIDLKSNKVLFHTLVAHGAGSGMDYVTAFSNNDNSHQSSLGFYVTADTYTGEHGNSLRLRGMENGFNSAAYDRGIVVHAAEYVSGAFAAGNQRIGRSWGCPAVNPKLAQPIINTIKGGTCLFVYYPQKQYLASSQLLNKKVSDFPTVNPMEITPTNVKLASSETKKKDTVKYIYGNATAGYLPVNQL
jgi:hypothetical protein